MRTVFATRRQFLVAAGAGLLAPGCLGGGGGPETAPRAQPSAPPRLVGPIHAAVPAGQRRPGRRGRLHLHARGAGRPDRAPRRPRPLPPPRRRRCGRRAGAPGRHRRPRGPGPPGAARPHASSRTSPTSSPALLDQPYDPGNRFSAPARHGAFGFAYRPDTVTDEPASWEDFFALLPRYSRRGIVLLPGRIEPIAAALAAGGADINSDDPDDLDAARTLLVQRAPARERLLDEPGRGVRARGARARDGGRVGVRAAGADGHVRPARRRRRVVDRRVGGHRRDSRARRRRTPS